MFPPGDLARETTECSISRRRWAHLLSLHSRPNVKSQALNRLVKLDCSLAPRSQRCRRFYTCIRVCESQETLALHIKNSSQVAAVRVWRIPTGACLGQIRCAGVTTLAVLTILTRTLRYAGLRRPVKGNIGAIFETGEWSAYGSFRWLVGALSPVNHKGLHQGWTQTSLYLQIIHFTSHHIITWKKNKKLCLFIFRGHSTREPATSMVTYSIQQAYTRTMC